MPETRKKTASAPAAEASTENTVTPAETTAAPAAAVSAESQTAPASGSSAASFPAAAESTPTSAAQTVIPMMAPVEPNVTILYLDTVMPGNRIEIGRGRVITGSGRRFSVPLSYFEGEFMTPLIARLLQRRSFLVLEGLTDEQRELYGCLYRPGEVIFSEAAFRFFLTGPCAEVLPALEALCPEHRDMVLRRILTAAEEGTLTLPRGTLVRMNALSRKDHGTRGLLEHLIRTMED